jgi:hypothetical protein
LIGHCNDSARQFPAVTIRAAAMIVQGVETGYADGNIDQSFAPGTAERISDNDGAASQGSTKQVR